MELLLLSSPVARDGCMSLSLANMTWVMAGWAGAWGGAVLAAWALDIARSPPPEAPARRSAGSAAGAGLADRHQVTAGEPAHDTRSS